MDGTNMTPHQIVRAQQREIAQLTRERDELLREIGWLQERLETVGKTLTAIERTAHDALWEGE